MVPNIAAAVIKLGQQKKNDELKEILERIPTKELVDLVSSNIGGADGFTLWHFVLLGMTHSSKTSDKRFQITMAVLQQLNRVELATKVAFDIVSRLVLDLPKFGPDQLVEILEYCVESIRAGDPKCMGWKDLLPDVLSLLSQQVGRISVNGFIMTGVEYRKKVLDELFKMKIQNGILTSFTGMFREVQLSREEATLLVGKVCDAIRHLEALEIPALTFQLFHVCLKYSSLLVLPIYSLQKYFHKHYYKRIASNDCGDSTDFDSIEPVSDKELREAEETILYHLSNVTEFRLDEAQVVAMFKPFQNMPEFLLTPFVISALIAMSKINRTPDTMKVVSSQVMAFLVRLVAENEHERELCQRSAWCRGRIDSSGVPDVNRILTILTEHSQEGMEVVTPGVIHFGFALLIAKKQPKLHTIGIAFLQNFIKKRFIFGNGIVDKLKQYLFVELEAMQFSECLITLSLTSALTLSECGSSISYILEYLLLIDGYHAMRIITFLFPLIRISHTIRDAFIEVLRKAMHHSETRTRMMGVFGFCALLKQLKNNNSRRAVLGGSAGNLTQLSISGMSLLSQSTLGRADNPDVHFDMLTLEILGILRRCFTQTVEIRELLYESLGRAVEFNGKLLPHVLQFVDWHFSGYFGESLEGALEIDFEKCVRYRQGASEDVSAGDQQLEIYDNVGKLTAFMVHCMTLADQQQDMGHDCDGARKLLEDVVNKIDGVTLDSLGIIGTLDPKSCVIACHYLNTVEAGMSYCIWKTKPDNGALRDLLKLFKHHQSCSDKIKKMEPKKAGRKAANNETIASTAAAGASSAKSLSFRPENVWDLATVERLLRIVFDDSTAYATEEDLEALRSNRDFTQFVLRVATEKLEALRTTPEYWQIKHSKRIFHHLCECGKIAYDRCVKRTNELCSNGNVQVALAAVECFRQALLTALAVYERKFVDFLRMISCSLGTAFRGDLLQTLHGIVDRFFEDGAELEVAGEKTIYGLLVCLEILYTSEGLEITHLNGAYSWLQDFCVNHKLKRSNQSQTRHALLDLRRQAIPLERQRQVLYELVQQLERSPSEKAFAVQEGAIELLKELRHSPDPAIVDSARLGLTLLGYVGPLPGQGIRILSIDGGGIRGLIVMELLRKLEKMTNRRIFDLFDIVCGVSAGANLVCALASEKNVTLDECIHLYKKTSHTIFHRPSTLDKLAGASRLVSSHAYYDAEMWEGLLKKHVGYWRIIDTSKLTHVPKICCVSTTICDQHIDAHVFRNYTFPLNVQSVYAGSHTARLWEVVRASTAAPAYFGDFQLEGQLHQDGGILYNNPTTVAIHEAKCLWPNERIQCVVSLGTGRTRTKPSEGKDGRKIVSENFLAEASLSSSWKTKFLRILDSATDTEATHTILSDLLPPGRYFRFNPYLTEFLSMVEVRPEKIAQLERDTNEYFKRNEDKFELVAEHLTRKRNIVHQTYDALRDAFR